MSEVESVALWAGLLSSVVGIVLSIVAIVFSWVVNKRADRIGDATIESLQRIESSVALLSDNTTGLIKAAWEKMLGNVGLTTVEPSVTAERVKELAAGIAAEIRSERAAGEQEDADADDKAMPGARFDRIEDTLGRLQEALSSIAGSRATGDPSLLDYVVAEAGALTPEARELFFAIRRGHISRDEYRKLTKSPLRGALMLLRRAGLLVPRSGHRNGDREEVVYYYPSGVHSVVEIAQRLLSTTQPEVRETVARELKKVGYGVNLTP